MEKSILLHRNAIANSQCDSLAHVLCREASTREITVMAISALVAQTRERKANAIYRHVRNRMRTNNYCFRRSLPVRCVPHNTISKPPRYFKGDNYEISGA